MKIFIGILMSLIFVNLGLAGTQPSELIDRAKSSQWDSYDWSESRAEWIENLSSAHKDHYFLVEHMVHDFHKKKIKNHEGLFSLFLRVLPCSDGEYAESIAQILAKISLKETGIVAKILDQEEALLKNEIKEGQSNRCLTNIQAMGAKFPMTAFLAIALTEELKPEQRNKIKESILASNKSAPLSQAVLALLQQL